MLKKGSSANARAMRETDRRDLDSHIYSGLFAANTYGGLVARPVRVVESMSFVCARVCSEHSDREVIGSGLTIQWQHMEQLPEMPWFKVRKLSRVRTHT